jgi:hypothetical protein
LAVDHRAALLRDMDTGKARQLNPLKLFGATNVSALREACRKSREQYNLDAREQLVNYVPRPGRGELTVKSREQAFAMLKDYAQATTGTRFKRVDVTFDSTSVALYIVDVRQLVRRRAENHFLFNRMHVGSGRDAAKEAAYQEALDEFLSARRSRGMAERLDRTQTEEAAAAEEVARRAAQRAQMESERAVAVPEVGEVLYGEVTASEAYAAAERMRLLANKDDPILAIPLFMDKWVEVNGESFLGGYAGDPHIPFELQSLQENMQPVFFAETLHFPTARISRRVANVRMRANYEHAIMRVVSDEFKAVALAGVRCRVAWSQADTTVRQVRVLPRVHALLLDDPQQHTSLGVVGSFSVYTRRPPQTSSCFGQPHKVRHYRDDQRLIESAQTLHRAVAQSHGRRGQELQRELDILKAKCVHSGISTTIWPPRVCPFAEHPDCDDPKGVNLYWKSVFMGLHNIGLCYLRDCLSLTLRLLFETVCDSRKSRHEEMVAGFDAHSKLYAGDWTTVSSRGLASILIKTKQPWDVRRNREKIVRAMRTFRVTVHRLLLRKRRSKVAALALRNVMHWSRQAGWRDMFRSETEQLDRLAAQTMPLLKTAFHGFKNFNRSPNWAKMAVAGALYRYLGRFKGALDDQHYEERHKLGRRAYRHFSAKHGDLLKTITDYVSVALGAAEIEQHIAQANSDLVYAAGCGLGEHVSLYLSGYADPLAPDPATGRVPGDDALVAAALCGSERCVQLLLGARAEANARDLERRTPLIAAASEGRASVVQLLLAANADPGKRWSGLDAIQWAHHRGHRPIVEQLKRAGCSVPLSVLEPLPRADPSVNRLGPLRRGCAETLLLSTVTPGGAAANTELLARCPRLGALPYALRVYCNGNVERVPWAALPELQSRSTRLSVRPTLLLRRADADADADRDETERLLRACHRLYPTYTIDAGVPPRKAPHFVSCVHEDHGRHRRYLGELLLLFAFCKCEKRKSDGKLAVVREQCALVHWMVEGREENVGRVQLRPEEEVPPPDWDAIEARLRLEEGADEGGGEEGAEEDSEEDGEEDSEEDSVEGAGEEREDDDDNASDGDNDEAEAPTAQEAAARNSFATHRRGPVRPDRAGDEGGERGDGHRDGSAGGEDVGDDDDDDDDAGEGPVGGVAVYGGECVEQYVYAFHEQERKTHAS